MRLKIAPILGLFLTVVVAGSAAEPVQFEGKAEEERIRVLSLIEGCQNLAELTSRLGPPDEVRTEMLYIPGTGYTREPGPCCTEPQTIAVHALRFASPSRLVDLDVIVAEKGPIWAAFITEKVNRRSELRGNLKRLFAEQPGKVNWIQAEK